MKYVIVSQNNWSEPKVDGSGRDYTSVTFRPPATLAEAEDWPGVEIVEADSPPRRWGHGTYAADEHGKLRLVASDWDSSG